MKLQSLMLCEAASVRENMLFVLGGGITSLERTLPSPFECSVAILLQPQEGDLGRNFDIRVEIAAKGAETPLGLAGIRMQAVDDIDEVELEVGPHPFISESETPYTVPVAIPFNFEPITAAGLHRITVTINEEIAGEAFFVVYEVAGTADNQALDPTPS